MKRVFILCGLPGSGKSTFCRNKLKESPNTVIISKDSIREMINGEYKFIESKELIIKQLNNAIIKECLLSGYDIIIDECHIKLKSRINITNYIKNFDIDYHITVVYCSENKDNLKNRETNLRGYTKETWDNVIQEMKNTIEVPTEEECFMLNVDFIEHKL